MSSASLTQNKNSSFWQQGTLIISFLLMKWNENYITYKNPYLKDSSHLKIQLAWHHDIYKFSSTKNGLKTFSAHENELCDAMVFESERKLKRLNFTNITSLFYVSFSFRKSISITSVHSWLTTLGFKRWGFLLSFPSRNDRSWISRD